MKRRYSRRPAFKRNFRRRTARRRLRKRLNRPYRVHYFRFRTTTPKPGGTTPAQISFSDNPNGIPDFTSIQSLYRLYRVNGIRIQYEPAFNMNDMIPVDQGETLRRWYIIKQDDFLSDPSFPFTPANFLNHESMRSKPIHTAWSTYFRMSKIMPTNAVSMNMANLSKGPWFSTNTPVDTQRIQLCMSGAPLNVGTVFLGNFVLTYYLAAKFRR